MSFNFEINSNLKNKILANIPKDYSNLEKALLIYKRLCESLQYSFDYFLEPAQSKQYFVEKSNLKLIDGENNKDVVCYTFNAILAKLFEESDVAEEIDFQYNPLSSKFPTFHRPLFAVIDGIDFRIDATMGVLDNNDLVLSKYSGHKPEGWTLHTIKDVHEKQQVLDTAIGKVFAENQTLATAVNLYVQNKQQNGEFFEVPIESRIQMYLDIAKNVDYTLFGFNNLIKYKHLIFSSNELGTRKGEYVIDQKIDIQFAKDRETGEYKAFLFFNPSGYTNDVGYENFDTLQAIDISIKNKTSRPLTREELKKYLSNKKYVSTFDEPIKPKMTRKGKMDMIYEYDGGLPLYDHHTMTPINIKKQTRHHVKTDVYEEIPLEQ